MANIYINNNKLDEAEVPYVSDVYFDYLGDKIYSAQKNQNMYGNHQQLRY